MPFAVVRARRKKATTIEIDVETKLSERWDKFSFESIFVIPVYESIECSKIFLDLGVERRKNLVTRLGINIENLPCSCCAVFGSILLSHSFTPNLESLLGQSEIVPGSLLFCEVRQSRNRFFQSCDFVTDWLWHSCHRL